jgi:type I restriction enzyme S subunit
MSDCKTVRLGDVATYINGYAFKPSDWGTEGLPIIRIQNLTGNDYETNFYNGKIPEKYFVKNGDVLISWSASLGVYEWKKNDALLNQHIFKVVFDKLEVDKKYFMFTVSNLLNAMSKQTHGSTMRHITKPDFDNMPFPLPPIEKQKQIARKLDKCNELILKNNRILEKYDLLIKSRFIEMIGDPSKNNKKWEIKKLGDIIRVLGGYAFSSKAFKDSGIPVLRIGNINSGVFRPTNMVFWDDDEKNRKICNLPR